MEFIIAILVFLIFAIPVIFIQFFIMYNVEFSILIFAMIAGFVLSMIILIADRIKKRNTSEKFRHVATGSLIVYLMFLLSITLIFRNKVNIEYSRIELIPFHDLAYILKNRLYFELFEKIYNVLLFVPYSFLLGCVIPNKKSLPIIIGIITTLSIEAVQYLTERGVFDINDIILNIIGTLIGYGIYRLFVNVCRKISERKSKNAN